MNKILFSILSLSNLFLFQMNRTLYKFYLAHNADRKLVFAHGKQWKHFCATRRFREYSTSLKITKAKEELKLLEEKEELYQLKYNICKKKYYTGSCIAGATLATSTAIASFPFGLLALLGMVGAPVVFCFGKDCYIRLRVKFMK
jgi:hypothetical protein